MVASFLPSGYVAPATSGGRYLNPSKITAPTVFRVLSHQVMVGWSYWNTQNKPVRLQQQPQTAPTDARVGTDGKLDRVKHFWAMVVWNRTEDKVQIFEITQATIQQQLQAVAEDEAWGHPAGVGSADHPYGYDLKLSKEGEQLNTEYTLIALPKFDAVPAHILQEAAAVNLNALWVGGDPFAGGGAPTPPPVAQPPATAAPAAGKKSGATPQQKKVADLAKLTGHGKDEMRALAAEKGLPSDSAQFNDGHVVILIGAMLLDYAASQSCDMERASTAVVMIASLPDEPSTIFAKWQEWCGNLENKYEIPF